MFASTSLPMRLAAWCHVITGRLQCWVTPLFDLAIRLYIAEVFFRAGWIKITNWESTRYLFENLYHVALVPPWFAAVSGTAGELGLSVLLALGLAGRFAAAGLFVLNFVAANSYPDISELGLADHWLWGALLLVSFFHGPGRLSLDAWIVRRLPGTIR